MDKEQLEEFYMFKVKIEPCDRQDPHNHSTCPYKHSGELCTRRDPRVFRYDSIFCYDLHNNGVCHRGANCPYSHNMHEYFLHPTRFRTRMCEFGDSCVRELCFFAHNDEELRPRVPIKVFSNTRRGGRRPRATPGAAAPAPAKNDSSSGASTEAGSSPLVSILQAPSLPYVAYDSLSTPDGMLPLTLAKQGALSSLVLGQLGAAGPQIQIINSPSAAGQRSCHIADPVNKASTGMQQLPLLFLQDMLVSEGSSAQTLLPCPGFDPAASAVSSTECLGSGMLQALPSALDYSFPQDLVFSSAAGGSPVVRTQSLTQCLMEPMLSGMAGNTGGLPELQAQGSLLAHSTPGALWASPGSSPGNSGVSYTLLGATSGTSGTPPLYAASSSVLSLPQQQQHAQLATSSGCAPRYLAGPGVPAGLPTSPGHLSTVTVVGPGPAMTAGKRYILVPMESNTGIGASRPANEPRGQLPLQLLQVNGNGSVGPGPLLACNRPAPACGQQYQAPLMLMQPLQQLL